MGFLFLTLTFVCWPRAAKKCYMSKEKGRLYVTNLHVGFYEKKKAGVWLEYPHILHISVEGSDLFITDHNTNEVSISITTRLIGAI